MFRKLLSTVISIIITLQPLVLARVDGQESQAPFTFIVVIDISLSMDDRFPAPVQPRLTDSTKLMDVKRRLSLLIQHLPAGTRVLVTVFDHQANQLCDLRLDSPAARDKLRQAFASVKTRNGSTHLWRTADAELGRAQQIVAADPESRVRVLLYTDGNDMENAPGLDHNTIIRKYGKSLQSVVRLDWITIGYDVQADVKRALQETGVNFTKADTPADIDPLIAGFRLSAETVKVGEDISLQDESVGINIVERLVDWGDKSPTSQGDRLRHRYTQPGRFLVRYQVKTSAGRTNQASRSVTITAPDPQPAKIQLSKSQLIVGESISANDISGGEARQRRWNASNGQASGAETFEVSFDKPGTHTIWLRRIDPYGQATQASVNVLVANPPGPVANFRIGSNAIQLGENIVLVNESSNSAERYAWTIDNRPLSTERHPTLAIDNYGEHTVELTVWDRFDQSHSVRKSLSVPRPEQPTAAFEMPTAALPGDEVTLLDTSLGDITEEPRWYLDGKLVGTGRILKFTAPNPGPHAVRMAVVGPGGEATMDRELSVQPFAPPRAGFTVGNDAPFVGDVIKITDTATGRIATSQFEIAGLDQPIVKNFPADSPERWFELLCRRAGKITVTQRVFGPGGEDIHTALVRITSRDVQPKATFRMSVIKEGEGAHVRIVNESKGSVERFEFDPGDGRPVQSFPSDTAEISHTYGAGSWTPKIIAYAAEEAGLSPSTWLGPEINVSQPAPAWMRNLIWQIPGGLLLLGGFVMSLIKFRELLVRRHQKRIGGHLTVRSVTKPRDIKQIDFDGVRNEEVVELDPTTKLTITSLDDEVVRYQCQLVRDGQSPYVADLEENSDVKVGDYFVNYTA